MEAAVNSLPIEILEIIFSYCTHSDLVQSIQNVCCQWREVAQSTRLWKNLTYCPEYNTSSKQVVEMLEISPKLQNIILQNSYDDRVLDAITENCSELRKLQISVVQSIGMNFMKNLQEKCPNVQYLKIPHPVVTELVQRESAGRFTNLRVLHLTGGTELSFSLILKPVADYCKMLEHLELKRYSYKINDFRYLLTRRKDSLHTLGVRCCDVSGECVLPALSTCELKSLSLFNYSYCRRHYLKIEYFGQLRSVKALSISTFYSHDLEKIFENENMAQLEELSLKHSPGFDDNFTDVIVRNCPLIKNLSLKGLYITDAGLKIFTNLKELHSLTISDNYRVTDNGVAHLQDVKSLKNLTISRCEVGLQNIVKLSTLQDLTLKRQNLAHFAWDLIPHHMKYLQCLRLHSCDNVDMCAIKKLKRQLPCSEGVKLLVNIVPPKFPS